MDSKKRTDMTTGTGSKYNGSSMKKGKEPEAYKGMKTVLSGNKK